MLSNLHIALTQCIFFWDICRTIIHINISVFYFLMQELRRELLVVKVSPNHFIHLLWIKASVNPSSGQQEKGNTLCWEHMWSLINLIRHTKISFLIASLVFRRFSCVAYRNGLYWGTSKLRHSKYLKKYELC